MGWDKTHGEDGDGVAGGSAFGGSGHGCDIPTDCTSSCSPSVLSVISVTRRSIANDLIKHPSFAPLAFHLLEAIPNQAERPLSRTADGFVAAGMITS
nr:hypothetical protein CFP56_77603 [Quercus suber]